MPLFKKKPDNLIPPVTPQSLPSATSPRSSPNTYTASRDDALNYSSDLPPYNRIRGAGDVYSRGTAELDKDRNELFSGYNPAKSGSGRFFDGPDDKDPEAGDDDDVEKIKQQTRYVKQESVNSTRNALRFAREAEETGRNTLVRLGEQSEKLNDTERYLDIAKGHSKQAADNTDAIRKYNRSIFKPAIVFHKNRKPPETQEEDEASYRQRKNPGDSLLRSDLLGGERVRTDQRSAGREQYKRYQFEGTASDDEMEDEMSSNLDEISEATKRLKALGIAMGEELGLQNGQIDQIAGKTERLDDKLRVNTDRLKKIK